MKAAVVTVFGEAPKYMDVAEPVASAPNETVVQLVASALSPRVRSGASGTHYTSTGELPMTPGIDGVGRLPSGSLVYFVSPDTPYGAMAEKVVIDKRRAVELAPDVDPIKIAAAMNPAMASWVALRGRINLAKGAKVLVLGATGNAGRAAVPVAHYLGAREIVAIGRNASRIHDLLNLGANQIVDLDDEPKKVAQQVAETGSDADIVLDFLWGEPARQALCAVVPNRIDDQQLLTWIQIGAVAGSECAIPSAALRATNLRIIGSSQGSVAPALYRDEIALLATALMGGLVDIGTRSVPLRDVSDAWNAKVCAERIVFVP